MKMTQKNREIDPNLRSVCLRLLEDLDTPISLSFFLKLKYKEWDQIACPHWAVDPSHYLDATSICEKFRRDRQAAELLRKYEALPASFDRRAVAEKGFWASEAQCKRTNLRLQPFLDPGFTGTPQEWRISDLIRDMKRLVRRILGPVPSSLDGRFGPGAVFESQGYRYSSQFVLGDKLTIQPSLTVNSSPIVGHTVLHTKVNWAQLFHTPFTDLRACYVRGNRFTTVPKDATKDRGICIEPGLNVFCQLGVGRVIRRRLKTVGIDLDGASSFKSELDLSVNQQLHRRLACEGSLSNGLATIDLSSASDTVSKSLVRLLLPDDWFDLLDSLRSPFTRVSGSRGVQRWVLLEKFSSMGNGFTFELETLLFYVISRVIGRTRPAVYGDDIVVPSSVSSDVVAALKWFGFTPNLKKTYLSGPFRESCGGDYFLGFSVTPYRLTDEPRNPADWIVIANGLRWLSATKVPWYLSFQRRAHSTARGQIPSDIRLCEGPTRLGDIVIHGPQPKGTWVDGIFMGKCWSPVHRTIPLHRFHPEVQMACALYGASPNGLTPRNAVKGYHFGSVSMS